MAVSNHHPSLRAKRGNPILFFVRAGLLRRFAPRNDGDDMAIKLHSSLAMHPGEWLRAEVVEPSGINVTDLAGHPGVARQSMSKLLNGRHGLSAEMAISFEKPFGLKADTLLRM